MNTVALVLCSVLLTDDLSRPERLETRFSSVEAIMVIASTWERKAVGVESPVHEECKLMVTEMLAQIQQLSREAVALQSQNESADEVLSKVRNIQNKIWLLQTEVEVNAEQLLSKLNESQLHKLAAVLVFRQGELSILNQYVAIQIGVSGQTRAELANRISTSLADFSRKCSIAIKDCPEEKREDLLKTFAPEWEKIGRTIVRNGLDQLQLTKFDNLAKEANTLMQGRTRTK